MDLPTIVNEIVNHITTIDWSKSYQDESVSLFETTIRYLGGILSAYDLASGPLPNIVSNANNVPKLLDQARNLANNLSFAFNTPTGIPKNNLILSSRSSSDTTNGLATIGSLGKLRLLVSDSTADRSSTSPRMDST